MEIGSVIVGVSGNWACLY